jgi:hypothetical protein
LIAEKPNVRFQALARNGRNGRHRARSCLFPFEEGNRPKIVGRAPAARLASRFPCFVLITPASDRRRRPTGRSAALPLNQVSKAFRQDQGRGAHLDDLDFASCDQQVERTATYTRKPTCIGNPHADGLDCKRRRRRRGRGLERHNGALAEQL